MLTAALVSTWTWERTPRHTCAVPAMPDEEKTAWLDLDTAALVRELSADERILFEALDAKARFRKNNECSVGRRRRRKTG